MKTTDPKRCARQMVADVKTKMLHCEPRDPMRGIRAISIFVTPRKGTRRQQTAIRNSTTKALVATKRFPYVIAGVELTERQFHRLCLGRSVTRKNVVISSFGAQFDYGFLKRYIRLTARDLKQQRNF